MYESRPVCTVGFLVAMSSLGDLFSLFIFLIVISLIYSTKNFESRFLRSILLCGPIAPFRQHIWTKDHNMWGMFLGSVFPIKRQTYHAKTLKLPWQLYRICHGRRRKLPCTTKKQNICHISHKNDHLFDRDQATLRTFAWRSENMTFANYHFCWTNNTCATGYILFVINLFFHIFFVFIYFEKRPSINY